MGQKLAKSHGVSSDKFLKPRGLYPNCDVDLKKLKRNIVSRRLAPCFPGAEDEADEVSAPLVGICHSACCIASQLMPDMYVTFVQPFLHSY